MKKLLLFNLLFIHYLSISQVGIGTMNPHDHAQLDVWAEKKGILIPRIDLESEMSPLPIALDPTELPPSLLVFNMNDTEDLDMAYYYWSGMKWNKVIIADNLEALPKSPWNKEGTADAATLNTDNIYQKGNVGIGEPNMIPRALLDVKGGDALINEVTVGKGGGDVSTNTANGYEALFSNTTGGFNTANGNRALYSNTIGISNTANGNRALYSNTTGRHNTANGALALLSNTTGSDNTANGFEALYSNTTGSSNTANGSFALFSNTTGNSNTANGYYALLRNTTGGSNTANGNLALYSNTTGNSNTANGALALYNNETGNSNTANGNRALYSNTTGNSNTANGALALYNNETGSNNVAIGYDSGPAASYDNLENTTAIGYNAKVTQSNTIQLGDENVTNVYTSGSLGLGTTGNTEKLDVNGNVRIRAINTNVGTDADKLVVTDGNGVLKTLPGSRGMTIMERSIYDDYTLDPTVDFLIHKYLTVGGGIPAVFLPSSAPKGKFIYIKNTGRNNIDIFATNRTIRLKTLGIGETIGFVHLLGDSWERFSFDDGN